MRKNLLRTMMGAGLLVGGLDISAALIKFYIQTGKDPLIVLKYIAKAVFGPEAYTQGNSMAAWGLLFHFIIAFIWTILFFIIYPKLKFLAWNRVVTGILYGIFIWIMMNRVVLPLTRLGIKPDDFDLKEAIIGVIILICAIGIPLSFIAHRYYYSRKNL